MRNQYGYDYEWDKEYCYPNSYVLKNKLNIMDSKELSDAEREITSLKIALAKKNAIKGNFDFSHLQKIHRFIFEDIYTWAGNPRHVNISKGNQFCLAEHIQENAERIFAELRGDSFLIGSSGDVLERLSYYLSEINVIHPFREGNGRTQRLFVEYLAGVAGYGLDFSLVIPREMIVASAESFHCRYEKMNQIFERIVYRLSSEEQETNIEYFFGVRSAEMKRFHEMQETNFGMTQL